MSEIKTINGKVEFIVIPIIGDQASDAYYEEWSTLVQKRKLGKGLRLSTIKESEAALLVNLTWNSNEEIKYKTVKESLFSLLKANGCWIKEWVDSPKFTYEHQRITNGSGVIEALKTKGNAADDYLLIIKQ